MHQLLATTIAAVTMVLLALAPAWAVKANLDLNLGYNDNVDETSAQQSSAFTLYSFTVEQPIYTSANDSITGYANAYYRDHLRLGDQWQATAGLTVWQRLLNGRLHATLFAELSRYADHIDSDDERDFIALGSSWQWFFNEKISTTFALNYEDSHYRNEIEQSTTDAQKNKNNHGQTGSSTSYFSTQRNDSMWLFSTTLDYHFSAAAETGLTLSYKDNDSTLKVESYTETGLESQWRYRLAPQWTLELWASHLWQEYNYGQERNWLAATRLNWQATNALMLYIQLDKQWHTAPRNADCYTETVSQCGVSWSY